MSACWITDTGLLTISLAVTRAPVTKIRESRWWRLSAERLHMSQPSSVGGSFYAGSMHWRVQVLKVE